jgi:Response regulator containing CheY-like receiver domain and AraC-type DNA-binding domain
LLRAGPPPSRFATQGREDAAADDASLSEGVWSLAVRDARETLFLRSCELAEPAELEAAVASASDRLGTQYRTIAFSPEPFPLEELGSRAVVLYRAVDEAAAPGRTVVLRRLAESRPVPETATGQGRALSLAEVEGRFEFLIAQGRYPELERLLREQIANWESESRPAVYTGARLRSLFELARRRSGGEAESGGESPDALAEASVARAGSYAQLADLAAAALDEIVRPPARSGGNEEVPGFFASIKRYIEENFSTELSLQSACAVFSISQTYLSRLFRKYEGLSFNDYLTRTRIAAAMRFLEEQPSMPLKEVAALCGYQDQFYFSRVFKAEVGVPPSEYAASKTTRRD